MTPLRILVLVNQQGPHPLGNIALTAAAYRQTQLITENIRQAGMPMPCQHLPDQMRTCRAACLEPGAIGCKPGIILTVPQNPLDRRNDIILTDQLLNMIKPGPEPGRRRSVTLLMGLDYSLNTRIVERSEEHTSELQSRGHLVC